MPGFSFEKLLVKSWNFYIFSWFIVCFLLILIENGHMSLQCKKKKSKIQSNRDKANEAQQKPHTHFFFKYFFYYHLFLRSAITRFGKILHEVSNSIVLLIYFNTHLNNIILFINRFGLLFQIIFFNMKIILYHTFKSVGDISNRHIPVRITIF